jgi:hypothetical protein
MDTPLRPKESEDMETPGKRQGGNQRLALIACDTSCVKQNVAQRKPAPVGASDT